MSGPARSNLPAGWTEQPLRTLLARQPSYGINAAASPYSPTAPTYVRITDIDDEGRFRPRPKVSVRHPLAAKYKLADGDLVVARTGASVGKSYRYTSGDGPLVFAGFLIRLTPDATRLDPEFLGYYLQSTKYRNWVKAMSIRTGQPGINGVEYGQLPVSLPSPEEQHSIAEALAEIDELALSLERLIAKKRDLRSGTMDELLSGRTRLGGSTEPWNRREAGTLGIFLRGRGVKRADVRQAGIPCIRYGELYTHYSGYIRHPASRVSSAVASSALPIRHGDLLFASSGETAEEIGTCAAYLGEDPAVAGGDIIVLRTTTQDPVFLASLMNAPNVQEQKARLGQGDAVVHISTRALASIELVLPGLAEQQAIAQVIVDMDAEIDALEARLAKSRDIKQGMMQDLLSGRRRLVPETAAA